MALPQTRITYTRAQLLDVGLHKHKLPNNVLAGVTTSGVHLSFKKTRRGRRAGRKQRKTKLLQTDRKPFTFGLLNAQSVKNKAVPLYDRILEHDYDILAITETWLNDKDDSVLNELVPHNYDILQLNRSTGKGGGIAIIYKKSLKATKLKNCKFKSFEMLHTTFNVGSDVIRLITLYRPPPSKKNKLTVEMFLSDFSQLLESKKVI